MVKLINAIFHKYHSDFMEVFMDKAGRIVLPKAIRKKIRSRVFEVTVEKRKVVLSPKAGLESLFGTAPGIAKGFYEWKKGEVKRENSA